MASQTCPPDSVCAAAGHGMKTFIHQYGKNASLVHSIGRYPRSVSIGLKADGSWERSKAYALFERIKLKRPDATCYNDYSANTLYVELPR